MPRDFCRIPYGIEVETQVKFNVPGHLSATQRTWGLDYVEKHVQCPLLSLL